MHLSNNPGEDWVNTPKKIHSDDASIISTPLLWMNEELIQNISNIFPFACGTQLEASLSDRGCAQLSKHSNHRGIKSILVIFILVWSQYIILLDMGKWKERKLTRCCHENKPRVQGHSRRAGGGGSWSACDPSPCKSFCKHTTYNI